MAGLEQEDDRPAASRCRASALGQAVALAICLAVALIALQLGSVGAYVRSVLPTEARPAAPDRGAGTSAAASASASSEPRALPPARTVETASRTSAAPMHSRARAPGASRPDDGGAPVPAAADAADAADGTAIRAPSALSDEEVAAEFASASFIRRETDAYERKCHAYRQRWRELVLAPNFARLRRVLVIDVTTPHWNGLGNSMDRWLNLLRLGHADGRATFLRMDPCSPPLPTAHAAADAAAGEPGERARRASARGCRFDLGAHFEADGGWSWRWDATAAERVRAAMEAGARDGDAARAWPARHLQYRCLRQSWTCLNGSILDGATGRTLVPWMEEMKNASVASTLFALFADADRAAAREGARRAAGVAHLAAQLQPASVVVLEILNEQTSLQQEVMHENVRARAPLYRRGGMGMCERHALTRPRAALRRALLPALRALEGADVAVTMHVRTGYADWQKYAPDRIRAAQLRLPKRTRAEAAGGEPVGRYVPPSHGSHWAEVERLLLDCEEAKAAASAVSTTFPPFCFVYKMGPPPFISRRSVNAADAARCALASAQPVDALVPPAAALAAARAVMRLSLIHI